MMNSANTGPLHNIRLSDSCFAVEQHDGGWLVLLPDEPDAQQMQHAAVIRASKATGGVLLALDGNMHIIAKEGDG